MSSIAASQVADVRPFAEKHSRPIGYFRDLASLTKPRITGLVLFTAGVGMWLAPGHLAPIKAALMLFGTIAGVGAANTLNCFLERETDKFMSRTRERPLPAGRLDANTALVFGIVLSMIGVGLSSLVNPLTGVLGAMALVVYVGIYTPMKAWSPKALAIGAIPGALPPLMGWTAVTANIEPAALVLFGILFFWQLPHFIAIAVFRHDDYLLAGLKVLPTVRSMRNCVTQAAVFAFALLFVSLLLVPTLGSGLMYSIPAAFLGVTFFAVALSGYFAKDSRKWARKLFFTSLFYLTLLFAALIIDAL